MEAAEQIKPETIQENQNDKKINFIKELTVKKQNEEYKIQFEVKENKNELIIKANELIIKAFSEKTKDLFYYQGTYTKFDIKKLSKAFSQFETIEEIITFLIHLNFEIEEKDDDLIIKSNINIPDGQNKLIEFNLKKNKQDINHIIKYILKENQTLNNNIIKSIEEIKTHKLEYKQVISKLKENINKKYKKGISILKESKNKVIKTITLQRLLIVVFVVSIISFYKLNAKINSLNNDYLSNKREISNIKEENKKLLELINYINKNIININRELDINVNEISNIKEENKILLGLINDINQNIKSINRELDINVNETSNIKKENKKLSEKVNQNIKESKHLRNEIYEKLYDANIRTEKLFEYKYPLISTFDSEIMEKDNIDFILDYVHINIANFSKMELLYRASRDGDSTKICHKLCDNKPNVLIIIESDKGHKFGGFSRVGYKSYNDHAKWKHVKDDESFLFSKDLKKIYPVIKNKKVICHLSDEYGLGFYSSLGFQDNFMNRTDNFIDLKIKEYFDDVEYDFEMNGGEDKFRIKEIEVYQLL